MDLIGRVINPMLKNPSYSDWLVDQLMQTFILSQSFEELIHRLMNLIFPMATQDD